MTFAAPQFAPLLKAMRFGELSAGLTFTFVLTGLFAFEFEPVEAFPAVEAAGIELVFVFEFVFELTSIFAPHAVKIKLKAIINKVFFDIISISE